MARLADPNDSVDGDAGQAPTSAGDVATPNALLARMVLAAEDQFRQITAEIHDDSIQAMTAAGMRLQILRDVLDSPEQRVRLDELEQTIKLALDRLRQLITELQPPPLDREGIVDALRAYVSTLVQATGGDYEVESLLGNEPPTPTRLIIYRVTQEALRNLGRDAGAARLSVTIAEDGGGYRVSVVVERAADDRGGPLHRRLADAIAPARERVEIAGGWLRTTDERPERPTVEFWVPVVADPAEHAR